MALLKNSLLTQTKTKTSESKKLFTYDAELNAWVRIETHLDSHNVEDIDELVVSEKDQSNLWYAW